MLSSLNAVISGNEIFKLRYNQIYQLKTTGVSNKKLQLICELNDVVLNYSLWLKRGDGASVLPTPAAKTLAIF